MKFLVIKKTKNGNLLLESEENEPVTKKTKLFLRRREAGYVFETIGRVAKPLYLAKGEAGEGSVLESK